MRKASYSSCLNITGSSLVFVDNAIDPFDSDVDPDLMKIIHHDSKANTSKTECC